MEKDGENPTFFACVEMDSATSTTKSSTGLVVLWATMEEKLAIRTAAHHCRLLEQQEQIRQ